MRWKTSDWILAMPLLAIVSKVIASKNKSWCGSLSRGLVSS
jgi:hypothetical protein